MKLGFLKDVAIMIAGKNTGQIVDLLFNKKNVNEFLIAKKLNLTINQTRNILYKLSDEGLVSFSRKKDKKKGWYTYFWTFNTDKALVFLRKSIAKEIEQFEHQLSGRELKRFYICRTCNSEISEENALINNFVCPECGEVYELNDSRKAINEINSNINRLRKLLDEIDKEIEILNQEKNKRTERQRKKIEKEKVEKRRKVQLERLKRKKKEEKPKRKKKEKTKRRKKHKINKKIRSIKNLKNTKRDE